MSLVIVVDSISSQLPITQLPISGGGSCARGARLGLGWGLLARQVRRRGRGALEDRGGLAEWGVGAVACVMCDGWGFLKKVVVFIDKKWNTTGFFIFYFDGT